MRKISTDHVDPVRIFVDSPDAGDDALVCPTLVVLPDLGDDEKSRCAALALWRLYGYPNK